MAETMSNAEYRQREGLSSTEIKNMAKSYAYFKYLKDNPEDKDSEALLFGRCYHKWVLEPSTFFDEFAIAQNFDRRTKEGKEGYAKFVAECEGKDVISQADFDKISEMRNVLYATPYCKKLLFGQHEQSYFWVNEETGLACKCRPDSFGKLGDEGIIIDLKTCKNAETEAFMRDAIKLNYDIQTAHYIEGMKANTGLDFRFFFIVQEKTAPYLVNILEADDYFVKSGQDTRLALMEGYKKCLEKNEYPGYMGFEDEFELSSLTVPEWIKRNVVLEESGE